MLFLLRTVNTHVPQVVSEESLRPVTIKQILEAEAAHPDSAHQISGVDVSQVTFVGQVRGVNTQPTNITYKIDDGTGSVDVKWWIDPNVSQEDGVGPAPETFQTDQYVRVWGRIKTYANRKHVGAHKVRPVADLNEVNYHILEASYVHLFLTRGEPGSGGGADGDSMFVDGGAGGHADSAMGGAGGNQAALNAKVRGCSANAKKVFQFLVNTPGGADGVHLSGIVTGTGMGARDVQAAADELVNGGILFTTVDDETWAILDY